MKTLLSILLFSGFALWVCAAVGCQQDKRREDEC